MTPPGAAPEQHTPGPLTLLYDAHHLYEQYDERQRIKITVDARETFSSLGHASEWGRLIARAPALHAENEALRAFVGKMATISEAVAVNEPSVRMFDWTNLEREARALLRASVGEG